MVKDTISVLLVDDDTELVTSLSLLLATSERLALAGIAGTADGAIKTCHLARPDVVVADVRMPGRDGINLTRQLLHGQRGNRPRVLVMTAFAVDEYLLAAFGAGASGFLSKAAPWSDVEMAIMRVHEGAIALPADLTARLVGLLLPGAPRIERCSERELDVLRLAGSGASLPEIAEALVVSLGTVRAHLEHLRRKLGARNQVELVLLARASGVFTPSTQ